MRAERAKFFLKWRRVQGGEPCRVQGGALAAGGRRRVGYIYLRRSEKRSGLGLADRVAEGVIAGRAGFE
jgi:hypothetical protein